MAEFQIPSLPNGQSEWKSIVIKPQFMINSYNWIW